MDAEYCYQQTMETIGTQKNSGLITYYNLDVNILAMNENNIFACLSGNGIFRSIDKGVN